MHTEKVRLYPNKTQREEIDRILYHCRKLYNHLLEMDIELYKKTGKGLRGFGFDKPAQDFTGNNLPSKVRTAVYRRLDQSLKRFYNKLSRFPRFKSENRYLSFETTVVGSDGYKIFPDENKIQFPRLGKIKAIFTRKILGYPKTMSIKKYKSGKYYAFIVIEDSRAPKPIIPQRKKIVGIDFGVSKFITTNEGDIVKSVRFLRKKLNKLRKAQRELSRKQKGSKNREKARIKVARLYEKVANCRNDFHFKVAHNLVMKYDIIVCEDLRIKQMMKHNTKRMRRAILDQGFAVFLEILQHMCNKYSCLLVKVDPKYTTQKCSVCGTIIKKDLSIRTHKCPHCGLEIDRDVNAAINVLHKGQIQLAGGSLTARSAGAAVESSNIFKFVEKVVTGLKINNLYSKLPSMKQASSQIK